MFMETLLNRCSPKPMFRGAILIVALLFAAGHASAAEVKLTAKETDFFEQKIRPVLSEHCYKCHSQGSEKIKGGLVLDSRDGLLKVAKMVQRLFQATRTKVC